MAGDSKSANDDDKKKGLALLAHDLKQKPLVPVKILFALIMASEWLFTEFLPCFLLSNIT